MLMIGSLLRESSVDEGPKSRLVDKIVEYCRALRTRRRGSESGLMSIE